MKARLPESLLLIRGVNEHPLDRTSKANATVNRFKVTRPKYPPPPRLGGCLLFASRKKRIFRAGGGVIRPGDLSVIRGRGFGRVVWYWAACARSINEDRPVLFYIHRVKK